MGMALKIFTSSLSGATFTTNTYKQTVTPYIEQLSQFQNQIFTLAGKNTFSSPEAQSTFNTELNLINNNLKATMLSMDEYYQSLPAASVERRNMLILVNAATLIESSLFQLGQLNSTGSDVEKMVVLEDYFRFRVEAKDTINLVRDLLAQY